MRPSVRFVTLESNVTARAVIACSDVPALASGDAWLYVPRMASDDVELASRLGPGRQTVAPVSLDAPTAPNGNGAPERTIALPSIPQEMIDRCDVAGIARLYSPVAMMVLAQIAIDPDAPASARAAAANAIHDRGLGKAVATTVMANPDGSALFAGVEIVLVSPRARALEHDRDARGDGLADVEPEHD